MRVFPSFVVPAPAAEAGGAGRSAWAWALGQPGFRAAGLLGLALLLGLGGLVLPPFFAWAQGRGGWLPTDPLLAALPRRDVALPIFLLMYGALGATLGWLLRRPWQLLRGLWAYALLSGLRLLTIGLVPLLPPPGLVPMPDPVTALAMHASAEAPITHDLFFSGHTATMVLLALLVRGRGWRYALGLAAAAVGLLVLVQRVHYSYDVLAAPLFAWLAYRWAGGLLRRAARA